MSCPQKNQVVRPPSFTLAFVRVLATIGLVLRAIANRQRQEVPADSLAGNDVEESDTSGTSDPESTGQQSMSAENDADSTCW